MPKVHIVFRGLVFYYEEKKTTSKPRTITACLVKMIKDDGTEHKNEHGHMPRISVIHKTGQAVFNQKITNDLSFDWVNLKDPTKVITPAVPIAVDQSFNDFVPKIEEMGLPSANLPNQVLVPLVDTKAWVSAYIPLTRGRLAATGTAQYASNRHNSPKTPQHFSFWGRRNPRGIFADQCTLTMGIDTPANLRVNGLAGNNVFQPVADGSFITEDTVEIEVSNLPPQIEPVPYGVHFTHLFRFIRDASKKDFATTSTAHDHAGEPTDRGKMAINGRTYPYPRISYRGIKKAQTRFPLSSPDDRPICPPGSGGPE